MKSGTMKTRSFTAIGTGRGSFLKHAVIPLILCLSLVSCRKLMFSTIEFEEAVPAPGSGIEVRAQYLTDPEEINELFHVFLPDSGIFPVQLGVRNADTASAIVYEPLIPLLRERFAGVYLIAGGDTIRPLQPVDVLDRMFGERALKYRKRGAMSYLATTVLPAVRAYYIFDEATIGRLVGSVKENSFFPVNDQYYSEPVKLGPGGERVSYLFFHLPGGVPHYGSVEVPDEKREGETETKYYFIDGAETEYSLSLMALPVKNGFELAEAREAPFDFYDIRLSATRGGERSGGVSGFILRDAGERGDKSVIEYFDASSASIDGIARRSVFAVDEIDTRGDIAEAVEGKGFAACAVNFTRKARVYFISGVPGSPAVAWEQDLDDRVIELAVSGDGLFAVKENGFCDYLPFKDGESENRKARLIRSVEGAFCFSGGLGVFGDGRYKVVSTSVENLFDVKSDIEMPGGDRDFVGYYNGKAVLVNRAKKSPGDTLVFFDPVSGTEASRTAVPGMIRRVGLRGGLTVQLERGVVARYTETGDSLLIEKATLLISPALEIASRGSNVIVFREEGGMLELDMDAGIKIRDDFKSVTKVLPSPRRKKAPVEKKIR